MRGGAKLVLYCLLAGTWPAVASAQDPFPWDVPGYKGPSVKAAPQLMPVPAQPSLPKVAPKPSASTGAATPSAALPPAAQPAIATATRVALERAKTQMEYRDWDAAIKTVNAVLKDEPKSAEALALRANAFNGKGEYDSAITDYDRSIKLASTAGSASAGHGAGNSSALSGTYANRAIAWQRKGDLVQAMADLDKALQVDGTNVVAMIRRAELLRRKGDIAGAVREYDHALRLKPGDAEVLSLRRLALGERAPETVNSTENVTAAASTRVAAPAMTEAGPKANSGARPEELNIQRGYALISRGEIDQSIAEFDRALVANPRSFVALAGRAQAFAMRQRFNEAMTDLNAALAINKEFALVHTIRGLVFLMRAEYDRALAALDEAVRLDGSSADAYSYRGAARAAKRMYDQALEDLGRAVAINPTATLAFTTRGRIQAARNRHDLAVADFDKALQLSPDLMATTLNRGQSFEALGIIDMALSDYKKVLSLKPVNMLDQAEQIVAKRRIDALSTTGAGTCSRSKSETCL